MSAWLELKGCMWQVRNREGNLDVGKSRARESKDKKDEGRKGAGQTMEYERQNWEEGARAANYCQKGSGQA